MLAIDAALERFAKLADPASANAPGSGACGGLGFAVLALGGRLTTGPRLALESASPGRRLDLVVTGCEVFDFASRGGGVLAESARVAEEALCPCVALAGEVMIGSREMRTMGMESAYAVREARVRVRADHRFGVGRTGSAGCALLVLVTPAADQLLRPDTCPLRRAGPDESRV